MKNADRCIREFILITLIFLPACSNPASEASPTPSPSVPGDTLSMVDEETVIDRFLSTDIGMVEFIAVKEDVDIPLVGRSDIPHGQ